MPNLFPSGMGYPETTRSCKMLHFDLGFVTLRGSRILGSLSGWLFQCDFFLKVFWCNKIYNPAPPPLLMPWACTHFYNLTPRHQEDFMSRATPAAWVLRPGGGGSERTELWCLLWAEGLELVSPVSTFCQTSLNSCRFLWWRGVLNLLGTCCVHSAPFLYASRVFAPPRHHSLSFLSCQP